MNINFKIIAAVFISCLIFIFNEINENHNKNYLYENEYGEIIELMPLIKKDKIFFNNYQSSRSLDPNELPPVIFINKTVPGYLDIKYRIVPVHSHQDNKKYVKFKTWIAVMHRVYKMHSSIGHPEWKIETKLISAKNENAARCILWENIEKDNSDEYEISLVDVQEDFNLDRALKKGRQTAINKASISNPISNLFQP